MLAGLLVSLHRVFMQRRAQDYGTTFLLTKEVEFSAKEALNVWETFGLAAETFCMAVSPLRCGPAGQRRHDC
jgi:hypothetical protein